MKKMLSLVLPLCLMLSILPARAAQTALVEIHAQVWTGCIEADGVWVELWDGEGGPRQPLCYNGTVYIPLWTAGLWLGGETQWDRDTGTVRITTGTKEGVFLRERDPDFARPMTQEDYAREARELEEGVTAQLRPDLSIQVDGSVQTFTNALGEPVYPLVYLNCVYLPVRSVAGLCQRNVLWQPRKDGVPLRLYDRDEYILIYATPTEREISAAETYYAAARACAEEYAQTISNLTEESPEAFLAQLDTLVADLEAFSTLAPPTAPVIYPDGRTLLGSVQRLSNSVTTTLLALRNTTTGTLGENCALCRERLVADLAEGKDQAYLDVLAHLAIAETTLSQIQ